MRVSLLTLAALLAFSMSASAQTYTYGGGPIDIPDGGPGCDEATGTAVTAVINVPDAGIIDQVDAVNLDISHSWVGDLIVTLEHGGTTVVIGHKPGTTLPTGCGDSSDGMIMGVNDLGPDGTVEDAPAGPGGADPAYNPAGFYSPNEALAAFSGMEASGDWTLSMRDTGGGDTGNLNGWSIMITRVPVELTAFGATTNGSDVTLAWETASETNNAGFEVQMRAGDSWNALAFVDGNGTTTEAQTYSHTVAGMAPGTHAFRLKQIDFDGSFEYSAEVEATIEVVGTHILSDAYPNPFNPQATFSFTAAQSQNVTATLYNALGQRVAVLFDGTVEANAQQNVQIDGAALASGLYVVRVNGERFTDALRVTLLK